MSWHKTNLALIFILVAIDVFLAFMLYTSYRDSALLPADMITEAKENLSRSGIVFEDEVIDTSIYTKTVYLYSADMFFAEEMSGNAASTHPGLMTALSELSGQSLSTLSDTVQFFDIPDGTSITVLDKKGTHIATAQISDKTGFEFSLFDASESEKSKSCSAKADELNAANLYATQPHDCPRAVKNFFKEVYGRDISAKELASEQTENGTFSMCVVTIDDSLVYDMPITFYIENGKILYVKGNIFFSKPKKAYNAKLTDGINILYKLPASSEKNITVSSQHMGYCFNDADNNETYLVPSWVIECSTDETQETLVFNALTGALYK